MVAHFPVDSADAEYTSRYGSDAEYANAQIMGEDWPEDALDDDALDDDALDDDLMDALMDLVDADMMDALDKLSFDGSVDEDEGEDDSEDVSDDEDECEDAVEREDASAVIRAVIDLTNDYAINTVIDLTNDDDVIDLTNDDDSDSDCDSDSYCDSDDEFSGQESADEEPTDYDNQFIDDDDVSVSSGFSTYSPGPLA